MQTSESFRQGVRKILFCRASHCLWTVVMTRWKRFAHEVVLQLGPGIRAQSLRCLKHCLHPHNIIPATISAAGNESLVVSPQLLEACKWCLRRYISGFLLSDSASTIIVVDAQQSGEQEASHVTVEQGQLVVRPRSGPNNPETEPANSKETARFWFSSWPTSTGLQRSSL